MERENIVSFWSAFALGGFAGACVALLYAPRSGDETRQIVKDRVRRGTEAGRETLRAGADYTREKLEQGAEYGRQMVDRVAGRGEEVLEGALSYAEAAAGEESPFGERRRKPRTLTPEA